MTSIHFLSDDKAEIVRGGAISYTSFTQGNAYTGGRNIQSVGQGFVGIGYAEVRLGLL